MIQLIFLHANQLLLEKLKWIFIIFQGLFGLHINFSKTKLIPVNLTFDQGSFYCSIFNSKLGNLSFKFESLSSLEKT
jgi:hypothetical protein